MMKREYLLWKWAPNAVRNACVLDQIYNFEETHYFTLGKQLGGIFPNNVQIRMDANMPRDNVLTDFLENTDSILVVSERLKKFFEEKHLKAVEYLPVVILDHKGKPVTARYYIANVYDHVDCLDVKASKPRYGHVRKEAIKKVERLVLDPGRVDPQREIFKIQNFDGPTLVSRELADAITNAKFTAVGWMKLDDYDPFA